MSDGLLLDSNFFLRKAVEKTERRIIRSGQRITSGKVVSEQTFGFWTELFERHSYKALAGRPIKIFSNLPPGHGRTEVSKALNKIRLFRNRLYHNEPICFDGITASFHRAEETYRTICNVLEWIDPELLPWISDLDGIARKIRNAARIIGPVCDAKASNNQSVQLIEIPSSNV